MPHDICPSYAIVWGGWKLSLVGTDPCSTLQNCSAGGYHDCSGSLKASRQESVAYGSLHCSCHLFDPCCILLVIALNALALGLNFCSLAPHPADLFAEQRDGQVRKWSSLSLGFSMLILTPTRTRNLKETMQQSSRSSLVDPGGGLKAKPFSLLATLANTLLTLLVWVGWGRLSPAM